MPKRMLIDATHPEQTRVAVVDGRRLDEFDFETVSRQQLKGNIYLAKVVRIEPSLQAAFVEYGGNRHGFLAFSEIHPDYYRIPVADRQALEEAMAEERAAREDQPYAPFAEEPQNGLEEDNNVPFMDEEVQETNISQSALPPAIGLGEPASGLISEPFALENESEASAEELAPLVSEEQFPSETPPEMQAEGVIPVENVGGDEIEAHREQRRRRFIRRYKIQEVIKRGQIMLIQVVKEERGNKGAALTTYLSLAGRYCVLMPNTGKGGGVSRKITNMQDRRRMKDLLDELEVPDGMAVILRTAGMERSKIEVRRDLEYLLRLWDNVREMTLQSIAPCVIYEEASLIKRAIRDLYTPDIESILVEGEEGFTKARDFMQMLMPSHAARIHHYKDTVVPLFFRYQVENQINSLHSPIVRLKSGGYIVINQAEALVAIDVNSGRSTRERNIEETATRTNLEAATEVARQLRLRDLAGLIVIDFIDMEDGRNNASVERRLKEAMRHDRARLQIGRISHFGLLELSRQRLRPSLLDLNFEKCPHCHGTGHIRLVESTALLALHALEEEGIKQAASEVVISMPGNAAQYILNNKREALTSIEKRYGMSVRIRTQEDVTPPEFPIERVRGKKPEEQISINLSINTDDKLYAEASRDIVEEEDDGDSFGSGDGGMAGPREAGEEGSGDEAGGNGGVAGEDDSQRRKRRGRRGGRRRGGRFRERDGSYAPGNAVPGAEGAPAGNFAPPAGEEGAGEFPAPDLPAGGYPPPSEEFEARGNFQPRGEFQQRRGNGDRNRGGRGGRDRNRDRGDRDRNRGGGGGGGFNRQGRPPRPFAAPVADVVVPGSVFELDTTPREVDTTPRAPMPPAPPPSPRQDFTPPPVQRSAPVQAPSAPPSPPTVADEGLAADKKKSGWWSKFTGS